MKKIIVLFALIMTLMAGCAKSDAQLAEEGYVLNPLENGYVMQAALPVARDVTKTFVPSKDAAETACTENTFAASCSSINNENLELYLNRDDVVYIDLRDYKDFAAKHMHNFESVPFFAFIYNAEANIDPTKVQLFGGDLAAPVAVYKESVAILNEMFPKDKTIFIMCQSGGRVAMMMQILAANGYDMSKVYNIGGMAQYTDVKYKDLVVDTAEFSVEATYTLSQVTRN